MNKKELKKLAKDIYDGLVFTDRHLAASDEYTLEDFGRDMLIVFRPLSMFNDRQLQDIKDNKPSMFYEYIDKASGFNDAGLPIFMSFQFLIKEEEELLQKFYNELKENIKNATDFIR